MEFKPVVFKVEEQEYAVNISLVKGIERVQQIVNVPNSNPDIKGIINLRGDVIPIYSLRHHFKMSEIAQTEESKFIVVNTKGIKIALEVDSVEEIHDINDNMIFDVPKIVMASGTEYLDKVININGRLILVINIERLLSEEQAEQLQKMVTQLDK